MRMPSLRVLVLLPVFLVTGSVRSQWDPNNGRWLKSNASDLRVMAWNVFDGICSVCRKTQGTNQWDALARIVASMQPDVLLLEEAGDNRVKRGDSASTLTQVIDRFLHGGKDIWRGGAVTSFVRKYAPAYDLPFVYVNTITDGYNRNVILSRYPFKDLNGDGKATIPDIPRLSAHLYQTGGNGGIRGFAFAELNLPDSIYVGDIVIGFAHLKAGRSSSSAGRRERAARHVAYVVDYWYQGAGLGRGPDPFNKIADSPRATKILDRNTPVVLAGDWNEDELKFSGRGPAAWLTQAALRGGKDGTDRDRSDMTYDSAVHVFTRSRITLGSSKLDYIAWQDSIAGARRQFVFDTRGTPTKSLPPPVRSFGSPGSASFIASDHRPVIVDLTLPVFTCQSDIGFGGPGTGKLTLCGAPLSAGNTATLRVTGATARRNAWLAISPNKTPTPVLGGMLVPFPGTTVLPLLLDGAGGFTLAGIKGGNGPFILYLQVVYTDPAQKMGFGFTNAIEARWLR